jgi:hypothetical protein
MRQYLATLLAGAGKEIAYKKVNSCYEFAELKSLGRSL